MLQSTDPFRDSRGNRYLALDTAQGEPLGEFTARGFLRGEQGEIRGNGSLGDILQILEDTALLLDHLHGDCRMLHLDLSPSNLYITPALGAGASPPM